MLIQDRFVLVFPKVATDCRRIEGRGAVRGRIAHLLIHHGHACWCIHILPGGHMIRTTRRLLLNDIIRVQVLIGRCVIRLHVVHLMVHLLMHLRLLMMVMHAGLMTRHVSHLIRRRGRIRRIGEQRNRVIHSRRVIVHVDRVVTTQRVWICRVAYVVETILIHVRAYNKLECVVAWVEEGIGAWLEWYGLLGRLVLVGERGRVRYHVNGHLYGLGLFGLEDRLELVFDCLLVLCDAKLAQRLLEQIGRLVAELGCHSRNFV